MGGIMIILAIVIATVAAAPLTSAVLLALFITLGHFVLGFLDDYIKVVKKRNLGLKAKQKMLGQILIAIVTMIVGTRVLGIDTTIWIPIADINLDIGVGYYFLVLFVLVGTSNAVNLTDGLDGLASGTVAIASGAYALVCYMTGHFDLAIFSVGLRTKAADKAEDFNPGVNIQGCTLRCRATGQLRPFTMRGEVQYKEYGEYVSGAGGIE
mgnify:CR=1 FL=1